MKTYIRVAKAGGIAKETVARYLPANYEVAGEDREYFYVEGHDEAGWTADDYVIPRLRSGLIYGQRISQAMFVAGTRPGE